METTRVKAEGEGSVWRSSPAHLETRFGRALRVMGVRVDIVQIPDVLRVIEHWIEAERSECHHVVVTGMHGLMEAHRDPSFKTILNSADLFIPDGISLVWIARSQGVALRKRASGPDLISAFFPLAAEKGYRNFFYGDTEHTLELLGAKLKRDCPNFRTVGSYAPPFRPLTPAEDAAAIRRINEAEPDVLWVGLGCPRQERWIHEHRESLKVPVVIGVGAAFRFLSGKAKRAPAWMGDNGFEWLWRFLHEPRKIWRRVLVDGPQFLGHVALEMSGVRKYE